MSFVVYISNKGYDIVLSRTEPDALIVAECRPNDAVFSGDIDLLFYKTVPIVWRLVGSYRSRRFVPFEENAVFMLLGLCQRSWPPSPFSLGTTRSPTFPA
ncbi:hypothetical protein BGZ95_000419 [Linnemannia exigua]|uniref:XPG-I domain-containing protein n=1 Tax=Linnemannia exigua TaxID=604196 RepID=A0AAD4D8A1_9FUNG|nr:hypothetical protein BGZ95_000419 [Linnemannia exigua]